MPGLRHGWRICRAATCVRLPGQIASPSLPHHPDECAARHPLKRLLMSQGKPKVAAGKPGVFLHDCLGAGTLAVGYRLNDAAMLILGDKQDSVRFRHQSLGHDEAARRGERQGHCPVDLPLKGRALGKVDDESVKARIGTHIAGELVLSGDRGFDHLVEFPETRLKGSEPCILLRLAEILVMCR